MDKQQMVDKIYEVIADKTLSFGCVIKWGKNNYTCTNPTTVCTDLHQGSYPIFWITRKGMLGGDDEPEKHRINKGYDIHIIGHPVMIGDVLDYRGRCVMTISQYDREKEDKELFGLLYYWKNKRLPIESQSEECIKYVYDLIS